MASRLTNDIRRALVDKIITHGFSVREEELMKKEVALADLVYCRQYNTQTRNHMRALPDKFLPMDNDVTVYVGGMCINLELGEYRRIAKLYEYTYSDDSKFAINSEDELAKACVKHALASKKFKEEKELAKTSAKKVLESVTSFSKLLEVWPEIEVYVRPFMEGDKPVTALAIPIASLNRTLDLPPETK